ncbi:hypothetical protein E3N88_02575 [Mikania micrantha]|uniref:non-specific serine/threonine protein kinase n=1 Tax=Mikania micrantha TaxID=192012 RepID=A0A5N6Q4C5_9ASTR|nr:hypothetical protein E3N88_02575 [Mikania micrantha]
MYSPDHGGVGNSRAWFSYEELTEATDGFSGSNLLGEGEREFRAEVEIISRVHHRHLVLSVGYCIYEHQRLLVYQYVPNNTLHYHLHGEGRPVMDWATRIKVAAGAARGLAYLHEDCHPRIIHRTLSHQTFYWITTLMPRYMAPEYASSGKLTEKSDVFSFGVVVLELITGRKPVDASQPLGDESLVEWVDPRLGKNYVQIEMFRMIEAAAACIRHLAPKRPRMSQDRVKYLTQENTLHRLDCFKGWRLVVKTTVLNIIIILKPAGGVEET